MLNKVRHWLAMKDVWEYVNDLSRICHQIVCRSWLCVMCEKLCFILLESSFDDRMHCVLV
jgi:hypothetical protein